MARRRCEFLFLFVAHCKQSQVTNCIRRWVLYTDLGYCMLYVGRHKGDPQAETHVAKEMTTVKVYSDRYGRFLEKGRQSEKQVDHKLHVCTVYSSQPILEYCLATPDVKLVRHRSHCCSCCCSTYRHSLVRGQSSTL